MVGPLANSGLPAGYDGALTSTVVKLQHVKSHDNLPPQQEEVIEILQTVDKDTPKPSPCNASTSAFRRAGNPWGKTMAHKYPRNRLTT